MSSDGLPEITDADIKSFLETAPLYSNRRFKLPLPARNDLHIEEIDSHCEICDRSRPFHDMTPRGGGSGTASKVTGAMLITPHLRTSRYSFSFTCVTCKKSIVTYMFERIVDDETVMIQKYPAWNLDSGTITE